MALILAFGAFLKNTTCLFDSDAPHTVRWSVVHGDLSDPAACVSLRDSVAKLLAQAAGRIDAVAHDLHPDFFSTHLALQTADELRVPAFAVQHHHAHIAALMAEHGLARPVLGLALDGVGLGSDTLAWGGELLLVNLAGFERLAHLLPLTLPGGDVAAREPWRMAAAALHACGRADLIAPRFGPVVGQQAAKTIAAMLRRSIHCPQTTAAGRWFDAAAGLLGLSVRQTEEAQAAIALEQAAKRWLQDQALEVCADDWCVAQGGQISLLPLFNTWLDYSPEIVPTSKPASAGQPAHLPNQWCSASAGLNLADPASVGEAAARFHLTLSTALAQQTMRAAKQHSIADIALGGGCFFNQILKTHLTMQLENAGLRVWHPQTISCGDAGLALGQAWVAAQQLHADHAATPQPESNSCV
ncbi:MAG TPA: carbamoyltransferase HypF [Rhodoferax sp.]|nr:carbamoyltransferase HypF [Rhodoferax sp.]